MKLLGETLYIGQRDGNLHTLDPQGKVEKIKWILIARDIYDMVLFDANSYLLASETGLYEIHDDVLEPVHLGGRKIKAIATIAGACLIIGIKDDSLIKYNLRTRVETILFAQGSFISLQRLTDRSFLVKSFESLLLVDTKNTYTLAAVKDEKYNLSGSLSAIFDGQRQLVIAVAENVKKGDPSKILHEKRVSLLKIAI